MMITMRFIRFAISFGIIFALAALSQNSSAGSYLRQAAISQDAGNIHINANSPRPLAQVLEALQLKFGWTVNYEDPEFTAAADLVDAPKGSTLAKLPSGAAFSVYFPAKSSEEEALLHIVYFYNQSKNPGQFELRHTAEGTFYVVGNAARDDKGAMTKQQVWLDTPVTITADDRTVTDTVKLICDQLATQGAPAITLGVTPRKPMDHNNVKLGGTKLPARELLQQALRATHQNLYWHLLYDPNSKGYFLDIHAASPPSA